MQLPKQLLKRNPESHKGDFGHVFVLAGSLGFTGAASLVCEAAMRSGAGLVTLGIPQSLNAIMEIKLTETMTLPLPETEEVSLSLRAFDRIKMFSKNVDVLAVGPGLSRDKSTAELIRKILSSINKPLVLDADGINALQGHSSFLKKYSKVGTRIFTPHPGEISRLLKVSVNRINNNRVKIAQEFSKNYGVTLVLKGYQTVVSSGKNLYINKTGNAGMATAGAGDVLTGMIAAFLAQGISPFEAAKSAVYLHGFAGDLAAREKTKVSLIASDIIEKIPEAIKRCS